MYRIAAVSPERMCAMQKRLLPIVVCVSSALVLASCGRTACKRICEWLDDCEQNIDDCEDECKDEYDDADRDCRSAMRAFGRCVKGESCQDGAESCENEAEDLMDDCEEYYSDPTYLLPGAFETKSEYEFVTPDESQPEFIEDENSFSEMVQRPFDINLPISE